MIFAALRRRITLIGLLALVGLTYAGYPARPSPTAARQVPLSQPAAISYWGMNTYLTKRERIGRDNINTLATTAKVIGVQWTREEFTWVHIEPNNNDFRTLYDGSVRTTATHGFGIIGMLLTTPAWARDPNCTPNTGGDLYWCPPANVNEYAQFASWMVERYDGDGYLDAPGSPRVAAWEIWNEPNDTWLWPRLGNSNANRNRRYGEMLVAAYTAIKQADPTALVLTGGVYVFDGENCTSPCDGLRFLQRLQAPAGQVADGVFDLVPAARQAFDVLSIHPYVPTAAPDGRVQAGDYAMIGRLYTIEGRVRTTRSWLNDPRVNRANVPIWITELGWCTAVGTCPGGVQVSEDQQASYMVRSMVIAQQGGVQHTSWFQLDDAFDDSNRTWANAAIVRNYNATLNTYPPKPAYSAYSTLFYRLNGAVPGGTGPVHTHVYDPNLWYTNDKGTYDYTYTDGPGKRIDVLWIPSTTNGDPASRSVTFPLTAGWQATLVQRDGQTSTLSPVNNQVQLTLTESPIYVIQNPPPILTTNPTAANGLSILAKQGTAAATTSISINNAGGGTLTWTTSASSTGGWLTVSPASGTAPGILSVTAALQGRAAGTYTGSVTVTSTNGGGSTTIPVRLVITNRVYAQYAPLIRR